MFILSKERVKELPANGIQKTSPLMFLDKVNKPCKSPKQHRPSILIDGETDKTNKRGPISNKINKPDIILRPFCINKSLTLFFSQYLNRNEPIGAFLKRRTINLKEAIVLTSLAEPEHAWFVFLLSQKSLFEKVEDICEFGQKLKRPRLRFRPKLDETKAQSTEEVNEVYT